MLRKLTILWIALVGLSAHAEDSHERVVTIDARGVAFLNVDAESMTISKNCRNLNGQFRCQAYTALGTASLKKIKRSKGGADPGALICRQLGALTVMGVEGNHDEGLFCVFSDASMVSADSLHGHALSNDAMGKD